jgi:hypothetical protein
LNKFTDYDHLVTPQHSDSRESAVWGSRLQSCRRTGALGAELIVAFKKLIENPVMMAV